MYILDDKRTSHILFSSNLFSTNSKAGVEFLFKDKQKGGILKVMIQ